MFKRFGLGSPGWLVDEMPFHINGPIRTGRTGIFASAATHAQFRPHFRNGQAITVGNHVHRFGGAIFIASAASGVIRVNDAIIPDEMGHAELYGLLGGQFQRTQRASRANLSTTAAFIAAISSCKIQMRLQQPGQAIVQQRRLQYSIGTSADAQMAAGAKIVKAGDIPRARRRHRPGSRVNNCGGYAIMRLGLAVAGAGQSRQTGHRRHCSAQ